MTNIVTAFGRLSPPTRGHEKMLDAISRKAKELGGEAHVHLSQTQDSKKNPLSHDDKVSLVKKMMPHHAHMIKNEKHVKTIIDVMKHHSNPEHHLHIVAGEDRVDEFSKLANKYNGKDYHYKSITVHSAGHRDPDADGDEGVSATKVRGHAAAGDFNSFKSSLPSTTSDKVAKHAYNKVRAGLNITEALVESYQLTEYKTNLAPDTKIRRDRLRDKLRKTATAVGLNKEKELEAEYGADWKSHLNHRAVDKALAATRGKKFNTFIEQAIQIKKKKTKIIVNPDVNEI